MRPFDYMLPQSLSEASKAWEASASSARLLAGGTDLTVALRHGKIESDLVIDLKRVSEFRQDMSIQEGTLQVPAATTMTQLIDFLAQNNLFPSLQDAASVVGSIQIRNRATLAGNICNASPAADTVPVLAMLGAEVEIYGPNGQRRKSVEAFIGGNRQIDLAKGEIVTAVHIPLPNQPQGCAFDRITRRRGVDLATANLACRVVKDGQAIFALGAVSSRPLVILDETGALGDPNASPAAKTEAIEALSRKATPISDVRASAEYRTAMLCVMAERALKSAHARLAQVV